MSRRQQKGPLIIIGGREDRDEAGDRVILNEVARSAVKTRGRLVIVGLARGIRDGHIRGWPPCPAPLRRDAPLRSAATARFAWSPNRVPT